MLDSGAVMAQLRSSTRYAAVRCLIDAFRAAPRLHQCIRTASTLVSNSRDKKHNQSRLHPRHPCPPRASANSTRTTRTISSSSPSTRPVENVAILGGGITGLTSAWYISRAFPNAKITVYESKDVYGGWFRSVKNRNPDGSSIVFEVGPRSLRPSGIPGFAMLCLVNELGLQDQLVRPNITSRDRYVYYPDHLSRMPGPTMGLFGNVQNMLQEPIFEGFLPGIAQEFMQPTRPFDVQDESIGDFIARRLGKKPANNLVSAVFHGIYAGDIWKLSAKSLFGDSWRMEHEFGSLTRGAIMTMFKKQRSVAAIDWAAFTAMMNRKIEASEDVTDLILTNRFVPTISFTDGLQMLPNRLVEELSKLPNVTLRDKTFVTKMARDQEEDLIRVDDESTSMTFDHVISTLQPDILEHLLKKGNSQHINFFSRALNPTIVHERPVDVAVVNVHFRNATPSRPRGFGYLIPQSVPFEQNPECALGVVFDSDVFNYDVTRLESPREEPREGEVMSVMLGGHWWDDVPKPSEEELQEAALAVLARHLGITQRPANMLVTMNRKCIPQYTVGHEARLGDIHDMLAGHFGGRLRVAGSGYTGVSVNDCILAGWRSAEDLRGEISGILNPAQRTGLERFRYGHPLLKIQQVGAIQRLVDVEEMSSFPQWTEGARGVAMSISLGGRPSE